MLNHLMHFAEYPGLQQRTLLPRLVPEARALAPPHSSSARSYDDLSHHNYDLVAISMGTGGWVFKISSEQILKPECLSQNVMIMTSVALHGIYATHQNKLLNMYPSLVK